MLKSGALGVAGALGIGTTAKKKQLDKFDVKSKFAAMSAGAPMASAAASAGSGIGGAEAAAAGVGVGMAFKPKGIIPALKRAKGGMQTISKSLFGKGGDKMEARAKIKAKTTDKLRNGFRKLGDKLTFRDVRKRHGGGNSLLDKKRDKRHELQDEKRSKRADFKKASMDLRRREKDNINRGLKEGVYTKKEAHKLNKDYKKQMKDLNAQEKQDLTQEYYTNKEDAYKKIDDTHINRKY